MVIPPRYCRPRAYASFAGEVARLNRSPDALLGAAVSLCMHELPEADTAVVDHQIGAWADAIRRRVHQPSVQALLAHGHDLLFDRLGLTGNADDYYNPINSYLPLVMETRRGIPITLALVYVEVMRRLGVPAEGVAAPGHFLVAVHDMGSDSTIYIDPFHGGRMLSAEEAFDLIEQLADAPVPHTPDLLPVATPERWLLRMLRNLQLVFARQDRPTDVGAMRELAALLPLAA